MKKSLILLFTAVAIISVSVTSCKKYEDGPIISLRSKKARVANVWKYEKRIINGTEASYDQNYRLTLDKSGSANVFNKFGSITSSIDGTWDFKSDKEEIVITWISGGAIQVASATTYKILRLKEKELWLKYVDSFGNTAELHLIEA